MRTFLTAILTIAIGGCASVSEVMPVGKDTYRVSSEMGGQFPSWSDVKGLSLKRANEFCGGKGRYVEEGSWVTHGARGWTPLNAELTFKCLSDSAEKK
ncbi:MAG: hypothetical protein Q7J84_13155 [Sulfuricaulis sp.]|nr:hypothetical protein [Sulfuricaulis sp.]